MMMNVIPTVFLADLGFAVLGLGLVWLARSSWSRRLATALFVYTLIEAAFHVPMENLAAQWFF